jgi:hypothetical protein
MEKNRIKHPAVFTDVILSKIFDVIGNKYSNLLDPFGGIGKIAKLKELGYKGKITCNELELEWATNSTYKVDKWFVGDAEKMDFAHNSSYDCIVTSPTYGNRMADAHNAKDASKRITYTHYLGRKLNDENTGRMQWGGAYRQKHIRIYTEFHRVLSENGCLIINISNHIRKGVEVDVTIFHIEALQKQGFGFIEKVEIKTPRMGFGANAKARTNFEYLLIFKKNIQ